MPGLPGSDQISVLLCAISANTEEAREIQIKKLTFAELCLTLRFFFAALRLCVSRLAQKRCSHAKTPRRKDAQSQNKTLTLTDDDFADDDVDSIITSSK